MRALLSVSDKTGLLDFARSVASAGYELISTGGTARTLREAGLAVKDVSEITGFPEMMDGRVKTLHPKVHGGLLALRDHPEHVAAMNAHGIGGIDLLCVNLYPFAATIDKPGVQFHEAIENIDIGGPAMIRSAAKNHGHVLVVTDPGQYVEVAEAIKARSLTPELRLKLAQAAFAHTAAYDALIADYLAREAKLPLAPMPPLRYKQSLRYGENPHQSASLYVTPKPREASVAYAEQLHGKELSYINLLDADAALSAVKEFGSKAGGGQFAACIVKHATPCGLAVGATLAEAFTNAYDGDPLAAFGGIVALSHEVDAGTAQSITAIDKLLEVIVAPGYTPEALDLLKTRWKNCRLLAVGPLNEIDPRELTCHRIVGGVLLQQRDSPGEDEAGWKVATTRQPTEQEWADLRFAWRACKYVKSNAIAVARNGQMIGAGAGQVDRMNASRLAVEKAAAKLKSGGGVAASDAFFPFPDGPELLLKAGITAIIHPGGSLKDQDSINLANEYNAAMVLTGRRHFRH
jgi:phosphoribosylaminoimidazolecarboxamide formyltransferase/IMP cyclohydrolase